MNYVNFDNIYVSNKTCRSCLSIQEQPIDLQLDMFTYCTSLQVYEDDNLPKVLCQTCFDLLNRFYYFKQQCVRSDDIFKRHLSVSNNHETTQVNESNREKEIDYQVCKNVDDINAAENYGTAEVSDKSIEKQKKKCRKPNKKTSSTLLSCQKCDKTFYKYVNLEAHMRKHFGMKPDLIINCNQCDKKFTNEKNLKSHLRVHTGERKYTCKTCGKAFAYLNVLKNHERAHAGIKKYVCHECGKKFVQLTNLNTHILQHTGEKPHGCDLCGRRFIQPSEFKLHMLRHSGLKNFACSICTLRFYTNANLQKHMGTHSDARPYACKICDKRFKTRSYMTVHNRTHTGERPFSCQYCPMKLISAKDRRNHHKTHTAEKLVEKPRKGRNVIDQTKLQNNQGDHNELLKEHENHQSQNVAVTSVENNIEISNLNNQYHLVSNNIVSKHNAKSQCSQQSFVTQSENNDKHIPEKIYFVHHVANKTICNYQNNLY